MKRAKKRPSNNPAGRPSRGLGAAAVLLKMDAALDARVRESAEREGVTVTEWLRQAARERALRQQAET